VIPVKAKKSLGQHFLTDKNIARKIVSSLTWNNYSSVLEIGPGMGVLTEILLEQAGRDLRFVEIDRSSVEFLQNRFPGISDQIISADVLQLNFEKLYDTSFAVIGNFPYNISSQLFFKILEHRNLVSETVCMIQKEVAVRLASPPGSRDYGILSVLLQAYYRIEYLFTVPPQVFSPPPKVHSAVIRLTRNNTMDLGCSDLLFKKVVKTAFNQRRKTLRNSLKSILLNLETSNPIFQKRPEQLGVEEFVTLTLMLEQHTNGLEQWNNPT
jgi:16S rRNA (adenine1518-N6/adenine1519-N6)-dimethyltransferase